MPNAQPPAGTPPTGNQSPGGIWRGTTAKGGSASFYVTEDGRLWSTTPIDSLVTGVAFGSGSLVVDENTVSGGYEAKGVLPDPVSAVSGILTCGVDGDLTERATLALDLACSDATGPVWDDAVILQYQTEYEQGSDLSTIAGNYTLAPLAATNMLNIAGDGTLFGMYNNGADCTVNGLVALIDARFNLYDVSWTFSACANFFPDFQSTQFQGIAHMVTAPGQPAGSFYLLMTGYVDEQLRSISVIYEPT